MSLLIPDKKGLILVGKNVGPIKVFVFDLLNLTKTLNFDNSLNWRTQSPHKMNHNKEYTLIRQYYVSQGLQLIYPIYWIGGSKIEI